MFQMNAPGFQSCFDFADHTLKMFRSPLRFPLERSERLWDKQRDRYVHVLARSAFFRNGTEGIQCTDQIRDFLGIGIREAGHEVNFDEIPSTAENLAD